MQHRQHVRSLTINVEGLWHEYFGGDRPVDDLASFDEADCTFMLGLLASCLQEVRIFNRYGRLALWGCCGFWRSLRACTRLARLELHGVGNGDAPANGPRHLEHVAALTNLRDLAITEFGSACAVRGGMLPEEWTALSRLTSLELRLAEYDFGLPTWALQLHLRRLHLASGVSNNYPLLLDGERDFLDLRPIEQLQNLEVLAIQGWALVDGIAGRERLFEDAPWLPPGMRHRAPFLPDLARLAKSLRVVSLTGTSMRCLPPQLFRLSNLEILDLRDNRCMMPYASLVPLLEGYPHLRLLDVRQSMLDSSDTERHVLKPEQLPWLGQQMRLLICGDKGLLCDARLNGKAAMREKILDEASDHLTSRAPWQPGPQPTACEHAGCCDSDVSTCLPAWRCPSAGALHGPGPWLLR